MCTKSINESAVQGKMKNLPYDQGGSGRHKDASEAYKIGYEYGKELDGDFNLKDIIDSLPESQAKEQRHKSAYVGFAQGLLDGANDHYKK